MIYENLVFEGGGIKGIAFTGAISVLENNGILTNIKRFAGSSAGALIACALAIGYSSYELENLLFSKNFNDFLDDSWGVFRDIYRILNKYGLHKGDALEEWVGNVIANKTGNPNITFKQLYDQTGKTLVITGACLNKAQVHYYHHQSNPNMQIKKAIRISISIPMFFSAVKWKGDTLVDGGLFDNYPIWFFDNSEIINNEIILPNSRNKIIKYNPHNLKKDNTLGFKLMSNNEQSNNYQVFHGDIPITNIKEYCSALIQSTLYNSENIHIDQHYWKRTIPINTGDISTTQFDLPNNQKMWLVSQGKNATKKFFEN